MVKVLVSALSVMLMASFSTAGEIKNAGELLQCLLTKVTVSEKISYTNPNLGHWQQMPAFEVNGNGDGGYVLGTWLDETLTFKRVTLTTGNTAENQIDCKFSEANPSGVCTANSTDSSRLTASLYSISAKGIEKPLDPVSIGFIKDSKIYCD